MNAESNIGPLIQTLIKMRDIFGQCQISSNQKLSMGSLIQKNLVISYTDTEENWLHNQFQKFQTAYLSVAPPSDYLEDLLCLLQNGRARENFVSRWMCWMTERVRYNSVLM